MSLGTFIKRFEQASSSVDELKWNGLTPEFDELAARLDAARTERRSVSK